MKSSAIFDPLGIDSGADDPAPSGLKLIKFHGQPAPIPENIARILEQDPTWHGGPRHDRYSLLTLWRDLPEPVHLHTRLDREIVAEDYAALQAYAIQKHGLKVGLDTAENGARLAAKRNAFDSLSSWISSLEWDGVKRLDTWVPRYLGCPDTPFHRVTGRAWLRACVARAKSPGLLVDIVPVLQGKQKSYKDRAISTLFEGGPRGAPWLAPLGSWRPDHPDTKRLACSRWIIYDGEFYARDARQVDALKAWVSRTDEQWTAKYANDVTVMLRRALLVCSVNPEVFLSDPTGHRRWLVWRVGKVDWAGLEKWRLQLLAEAAHGDWREGLEDVETEQREVAESAEAEDGVEAGLQALLLEGKWTAAGASSAVLSSLLGVSPERQDKAWTTRLGIAVQKVGGSVKRAHGAGSAMIRVYYP